MLIDTHCHIHWKNFGVSPDEVMSRAHKNEVMKMICVGTNYEDSLLAVDFAGKYEGVYSSVGIHPHYANGSDISDLVRFLSEQYREKPNLVAIGETGLDYYRSETSREDQIKLFQQQVELAINYNIPIIFHVREAYDDFWPILDNFKDSKIRGVLHSFTDSWQNVEEGLRRDFYFGLNGISTFTKDDAQKSMYKKIPLEKLLFETDAPFLTPTPLRGKIDVNESAYVREIAEYNAQVRQITLDEISKITTENAISLFAL